MDKDVKVEPANHYGLNLFNRHGKFIGTAPHIDRLLDVDPVLDWAPELTEYTDIDNNSSLQSLKMTGHTSRNNAERLMLWHRHRAHVGLKALEMLPKVVADPPRMTVKCDRESYNKCKLARKPCTPTTSRATEPLQLMHSDIWGPLETAITGGRHMLLFNDDVMRHTDEHILKNRWEALEKFKEWKALRAKESGKQVKRFRTDGGGEFTSNKFAG